MKNKTRIGRFKISFEIGLFAILLLLALIVVICYLFISNFRQEIVFIISVLGGSAAIYSAYYAGENLKRNYEYNKRIETFYYIKIFDQIDFTKMSSFLEISFNPKKMKQGDIYKKIFSNHGLLMAVRSVMNLCEDISMAVQHDFIDEEIIYQAVNDIYKKYVRVFRPFIEGHRKKFKSESIYIECEKLANSWESKKYLSTGKEIK